MRRLLLVPFLTLLLAPACARKGATNSPHDPTPAGSDAGPATVPGDDAVPDFALQDVNSASPTGGEAVSPRDHLERVSGWYFTHAT